jgi:ATP-dependent Lon protease
MECRFQERLQQYGDGIPEEAQRVIDEELAKLGSLEPSSSEFNVTRNYLDWLSSIPWGVASTERLDIVHAQQVGACPVGQFNRAIVTWLPWGLRIHAVLRYKL